MIKLKASCHPAHLWTEVIGPRGAIGRSRHLQPGARLADAEKTLAQHPYGGALRQVAAKPESMLLDLGALVYSCIYCLILVQQIVGDNNSLAAMCAAVPRQSANSRSRRRRTYS
jgi:hypothetical protein